MTKKEKIFAAAGLMVLLLLLSNMARASYRVITDWLIPQFEGFRDTPYWDVSRYSWGYGTPAPGPDGSITRAQALADMNKVLQNDYLYLSGLIKRNLTGNQWAALLSFSYNLGPGAADNLVTNINSGNDAALGVQWNSYVNSGGSVNPDLVDRRAAEWQIWQERV